MNTTMSNTTTHEPVKVYFTSSEVCKLLDCKTDWLRDNAEKLGFLDEDRGKHHRYSVPEINALTEIRKTKKNKSVVRMERNVTFVKANRHEIKKDTPH